MQGGREGCREGGRGAVREGWREVALNYIGSHCITIC